MRIQICPRKSKIRRLAMCTENQWNEIHAVLVGHVKKKHEKLIEVVMYIL